MYLDNHYTLSLLSSVLLEDFYANSVAPMVIQIVYVNGATVRTGVEIEGSLVVRMLQYGDVVESFQRLKTKEGTYLTMWALSTLYSCPVLSTTRMSTSGLLFLIHSFPFPFHFFFQFHAYPLLHFVGLYLFVQAL